jgi:hypothetical protein
MVKGMDKGLVLLSGSLSPNLQRWKKRVRSEAVNEHA